MDPRNTLPVVLTIAGSDSSGGAGIQADLLTFAAHGCYGASVITSITAQNTRGVHHAEAVNPSLVAAQLDAVLSDLPVAVCKLGMLPNRDIIAIVAQALQKYVVVCDPVMVSTSGYPLLNDDAITAMVRDIFPLATLVTPNVHEAQRLTGIAIHSPDDATRAAHRMLEQGAKAVLLKGGHLSIDAATDVLVTRTHTQRFVGEWNTSKHTHGTGCTYASAIAAQLAHGASLIEAVTRAKTFITRAIAAGLAIGHGVGPVDPAVGWRS